MIQITRLFRTRQNRMSARQSPKKSVYREDERQQVLADAMRLNDIEQEYNPQGV